MNSGEWGPCRRLPACGQAAMATGTLRSLAYVTPGQQTG